MMCWKFISIVIIGVVTLTALTNAAPSPTAGCRRNGQSYKVGTSFPSGDGCNKCRCFAPGRIACTRRACGCRSGRVFYKVGARFPSNDGCNTCTCSAPGRIVCTKKACRCTRNGVHYKIGATFPADDGCNICTCISHGSVTCTEKACGCVRNGIFYKVGATFPAGDGCNTCTCTKNGFIACTLKACLGCPVKGQVFTKCASACPPTCTNPKPVCTRQCVPRCQCPRGTVINQLSRKCVRVKDCPTQCPPDKPLVNCFVDPCQFAKCSAHPKAKCSGDYCGGCNARFFDSKGNEVTESCECPVQGQLFTSCGSACPANCTNPHPPCTKQCVARCECPHRTVINEKTKKCTPVKKCSRQICPLTQVFNGCGSACTPTCSDPNPICIQVCVPRCECPHGTVLRRKRCIPQSQCPPRKG